MEKKKLNELEQRRKELVRERESWKQDWRELSRYFLPRKGRFLEDGERSNQGGLMRGSLDSTGIYAMRDLAAGLQGGMTSPARPWFKLATQDSVVIATERIPAPVVNTVMSLIDDED